MHSQASAATTLGLAQKCRLAVVGDDPVEHDCRGGEADRDHAERGVESSAIHALAQHVVGDEARQDPAWSWMTEEKRGAAAIASGMALRIRE